MIKIGVKIDGLDAVKARLRGLADKKIKVAAVAALNDAAYLGKKATEKRIAEAFDRVTPWIARSVRYVKARHDRLESSIDFEQWGNKVGVTASQVLSAEIYGGQRRHKRHEVALQRIGILPSGMFIVPGEAAQMDSFGNMNVGQIRQILSWFNAAQMSSGYKSNMTDKTRSSLRKGSKKKGTHGFEYFVVQPGQRRQFQRANGKTGSHSMQPGIYQRVFLGHGTAIKPVMIFVRAPAYKQRLDFYRIAGDAAMAEFKRAFPMYLEKLLQERGL
jgi:hypothetical protein